MRVQCDVSFYPLPHHCGRPDFLSFVTMRLIHSSLFWAACQASSEAPLSEDHSPPGGGGRATAVTARAPAARRPWNVRESISIYFIRHAQSKWNEAKGMKKGGFLSNVPLPLADPGKFIDAELSLAGIGQARELAGAIATAAELVPPLSPQKAALKVLSGVDLPLRARTYIATSNLRRALLTELIALRSRARRHVGSAPEVIHILSSTQELSGGEDARTRASSPGDVPEFDDWYNAGFEIRGHRNAGEENGILVSFDQRLVRFCDEAQDIHARGFDRIILTGHSTWLQELFR